jgi:hypothetical protein
MLNGAVKLSDGYAIRETEGKGQWKHSAFVPVYVGLGYAFAGRI